MRWAGILTKLTTELFFIVFFSSSWPFGVGRSFDRFLPSIGGRTLNKNAKMMFEFHPVQMRQIGLMLSLKLSNGEPNPPTTFGQGIFPFSLFVQSIEFIRPT